MMVLLAAIATAGGPPAKPAKPVSGPAAVVVATARGEAAVPVFTEQGSPVIPLLDLAVLLPLASRVEAGWAVVSLAGEPFRFLLEAPWFERAGVIEPLVGSAHLRNDTLFIPLEWLTDYVPRVFHEAYHFDPLAMRFEESSLTPVIRPVTRRAAPSAPGPRLPPGSPLRAEHMVVVDAGHGGVDPGNPGLFFPGTVREKDITLSIARRLRDELERRGVRVRLTRTRDTLIDLYQRAPMCDGTCDLFVSIHVNSLPARSGYRAVRGIETYFLSEARTAEARRVAEMENDALRYETHAAVAQNDQLAFILKDLQANEYLRESAALAQAIQARGAGAHPGGDRGVSQARFVVLSTARRPAVLVETGFSTNREDARFLVSEDGQTRLAKAIADGVIEYLVQYEQKVAAGTPQ